MFTEERKFTVKSQWPWDALRSHDDDRRPISQSLPKSWNDVSSRYIPETYHELKLLHVEGPGYNNLAGKQHGGVPKLTSMLKHPDSQAGIHVRLVSNLIHFIRNAPNSTHMIAVVDGQAMRTYEYIRQLLDSSLIELYPQHAHFFGKMYDELAHWEHISLERMLGDRSKSHLNKLPTLKLRHLLQIRGIRLHVLPLTTPSIAFTKSVCGVQYAFTSYLAARFAADYQVILYVDADSAVVESKHQILQEILYHRFFSPKSNKCVGHRFRLLEQYVKPGDESNDSVLECARQLTTNTTQWKFVNRHCNLKEGHIAVRADSIYEFNVHHPDTLLEYVPHGVQDCITPGNEETQEYFFRSDEVVEIHLRNRPRKDVCTCFADIPVDYESGDGEEEEEEEKEEDDQEEDDDKL